MRNYALTRQAGLTNISTTTVPGTTTAFTDTPKETSGLVTTTTTPAEAKENKKVWLYVALAVALAVLAFAFYKG